MGQMLVVNNLPRLLQSDMMLRCAPGCHSTSFSLSPFFEVFSGILVVCCRPCSTAS